MSVVIFESYHAMLHIKVLLGIGKSYNLESKRDYFILDAATVAYSYIILVFQSMLLVERKLQMTSLFLGHLFLHMYYISRWTVENEFFVQSIIQWSTERNQYQRIKQNGVSVFLWNTIGTMFDIYVHLYMASLAWSCLKNINF